jgi:hypothetical protein
MRIVKPGQDGFHPEVDFATAAGCEVQDILIGTHGKEPPSANGNRLGARLARIDRPEVAVVKDQIGLASRERKECKCA